MAEKSKIIEDKSRDLQEKIKNERPTVVQLRRMLEESSQMDSKRHSPPPIPPKPRHGFEITIETARRNLGLIPPDLNENSLNRTYHIGLGGDEDYGTTTFKNDNEDDEQLNDDNSPSCISKVKLNSTKLDATYISDFATSRPHFYENNQPYERSKAAAAELIAETNQKSHGGCVVYDSASSANIAYQNQPSMASYNSNNHSKECNRNLHHRAEPFVTESPDEANNNDVIRRPSNNTSTVEILEVPVVIGRVTRDNHGNSANMKSVNARPGAVGKLQHVVPPATTRSNNFSERAHADVDDVEDYVDEDTGDEGIQLANEVEKIVNEQCLNVSQPPRTSTPTSSTSMLYHMNSNSSSGASTATNNNRSERLAHLTQLSTNRDLILSDNNSEEDTLNISRDTNESNNVSAHNQSGCELIGVNDNSDPKDSPKKNVEQEQTPYTVQFFNDTSLATAASYSNKEVSEQQTSPPEVLHRFASNKSQMSSQQELENKSLRVLVASMQNDIDSLNSKVTFLGSKVEDLEVKLEQERRLNLSNSKLGFQNNGSQQDNGPSSMGPDLQRQNSASQSVATINRLTPIKGSRHNSSHGPMSTYSRATYTPVNSQAPSRQNSSFSTSGNTNANQTFSLSARRLQHSQSNSTTSGNTVSRPTQMRKSNIYTSTSSLYADSNKSGSASISPTSFDTINNRPNASSSSHLNLSQRRDTSAYNSMLSLSSIGHSTLKKSSVAGSVSNLSQFGASQLSNWPSMSNFIDPKHQAKDIMVDESGQVIRMILYNSPITMRVPSWLRDDYYLDGNIVEPPAVKLKLDWVHGYRGRDCRSNIYYLPTGECIYFVASVVVLYNPDERTQRHYLGHTDSVKCLAVHPNKLIVASGQSAVANRRDKRPIVRVWNTVSLTTLRVIGFNEDFDRSICCLAFSKHDAGATLAVVDESSEHTITLLDWQREKNWRVAEVNSGHEPVLAIDFHPIDKYSLVAIGKSSINFWDIRGMTLAKKAGLFDKYDRPKYVLCMTFNDISDTITGDSNGNIIIWPRGTNKPGRIIRDAHPGGVFSVLAMKDGSYLTGGRDRRIVEWDENFEPTGREVEIPEQCGGVRFITYARGFQVFVGTLRNSILMGSLDSEFQIIVQGHTEATSALSIHPIERKYLTGGFDEQIHLIDAQTHCIEWSKCLAMPITAASFSPNGTILIVGSTSGNWLALDALTQDIIFTTCDGTGTVNCIKFSADGKYLCLGSSDCQLYIYSVSLDGTTFSRMGTCVGHSAPVREVDWSEDGAYVQSQSMNFELLFWKAQSCRPADNDDIVHDLKWTTHNCTIGFNVIGIWSDSIDAALINYCDKSNNDKYIVSATDTGCINIYRWPTYYNQCLSQKYYGNVDKYNFVKFLQDDSKLIAIDAKGCATTVWSVIEDGSS